MKKQTSCIRSAIRAAASGTPTPVYSTLIPLSGIQGGIFVEEAIITYDSDRVFRAIGIMQTYSWDSIPTTNGWVDWEICPDFVESTLKDKV